MIDKGDTDSAVIPSLPRVSNDPADPMSIGLEPGFKLKGRRSPPGAG